MLSNIIGYLIGIAGIFTAGFLHKKQRKERLHRQQRFEWNHIYQGVRQICTWLRHDGFTPNFLIGVPGAGIILTELAVIELDESLPIYMIQQKPAASSEPFVFTDGIELRTAKWRYWIPNVIFSQKHHCALILDDYAQSGDTLREIKGALTSRGFTQGNVRTAALIAMKSLWESQKQPDYAWFKVDTHEVHMPWGHASKKVRIGEVEPT